MGKYNFSHGKEINKSLHEVQNCHKPGEEFCNGVMGKDFDLQQYPCLRDIKEKPIRKCD